MAREKMSLAPGLSTTAFVVPTTPIPPPFKYRRPPTFLSVHLRLVHRFGEVGTADNRIR